MRCRLSGLAISRAVYSLWELGRQCEWESPGFPVRHVLFALRGTCRDVMKAFGAFWRFACIGLHHWCIDYCSACLCFMRLFVSTGRLSCVLWTLALLP